MCRLFFVPDLMLDIGYYEDFQELTKLHLILLFNKDVTQTRFSWV